MRASIIDALRLSLYTAVLAALCASTVAAERQLVQAGTGRAKPSQSRAASGGKARLTYALWEGLLTGTAGGRPVHIRALSGGGGGSTKSASDPFAVNNPTVTEQKENRRRQLRGGPIPVGTYVVHPPAAWSGGSIAAVLTPRYRTNRDGFLIHGRGPLGSDGCIVPLDQAEFTDLMNRLRRDGGGLLEVVDAGRHATFK
jgi:hypothetical protein